MSRDYTDGQEVGRLFGELFTMAYDDPFRDTLNAECFLGANRERAHAIGERLNQLGGFDLMELVHDNLAASLEDETPCAGGIARGLELNWEGIGSWRG